MVGVPFNPGASATNSSSTDATAPAPQGRGFFGSIAHGWNVLNSARDRGFGNALSFVVGGAVDLVDSVPKIAGYDTISKQVSGNDLNARRGMNDWFDSSRRNAEIIIHGEEIKPETALERGLDTAGDLLGGIAVGPAARLSAVGNVVKVGNATLKGSTALQTGVVTEKSVAPIDALVDFLANGSRAATNSFAAGTRFGSLDAAKAAGLTAATAFGGSAANILKGAAALVPSHTGTLLANTAIGGTRLVTVGALRTATRTAGFSLRHPVIAGGAAVTADATLNNGRMTRAATSKVMDSLPGLATSTFGMAAAALPALTPNIDFRRWFQSNTGTRVPVMKALEQSLGINIPDQWETKGNQLMRDFGNSSFGQWLMGGSWGSKLLLGLLTFMLFDGIKDRIIGNDMATNVVSLGVAALASQMLPDLIKAMSESTMDGTAPANDDINAVLRPQTLDFAPSNSGGMAGMSFAPAGP
jgi:hypothetical protein